MKNDVHQSEYILKVEHLVKKYKGVVAVDGISFKIRRGEFFSILGPNGAGKTTTVEIIETIRTPTSGRVTLFGMDVFKNKEKIVPRIGVLPQGFSSFDKITVRETLQYFSRLFGVKGVDIDELIRCVDLEDKRNELYRNLSGGLKQRLGVAIALVNDPEVVFLDEPTTGLDPGARREVWSILEGLKKRGKTIILTTHYMEEAEFLSDRVAIMCNGKIIAIGSPSELIDSYTKSIYLTLRGAEPRVVRILEKMGFPPCRNKQNDLIVEVTQLGDIIAIIDRLRNEGAGYNGLDVRKPNLEEVFLKLTGKKLQEEETIA
jgi:ABC-2 type transport system ATP-binding protein